MRRRSARLGFEREGGRRRLTEFELGGLVGEVDGITGDLPWAALGFLRGERPRPHGHVDPLHRRRRSERQGCKVDLGIGP